MSPISQNTSKIACLSIDENFSEHLSLHFTLQSGLSLRAGTYPFLEDTKNCPVVFKIFLIFYFHLFGSLVRFLPLF